MTRWHTSDEDLEREADRLDQLEACPLCGGTNCTCLYELLLEQVHQPKEATP